MDGTAKRKEKKKQDLRQHIGSTRVSEIKGNTEKRELLSNKYK
jgi:hypothetical protein